MTNLQKRYRVSIQGDRYPVHDDVEAENWEQAVQVIAEKFPWDRVKLSRMTNKVTIVLEKLQS